MGRNASKRKEILLILLLLALILNAVAVFTTEINREVTPVEPGLIGAKTKHEDRPQPGYQAFSGKHRGPSENQSCPANQFVAGIDGYGKIQCRKLETQNLSMTVQEQECHGHGYVKDGFCRCDDLWTGAECEKPKETRPEDALPDHDFDNVPEAFDCDDYDDMVYPGAPDAVDGKDNDCDGEIDEGY